MMGANPPITAKRIRRARALVRIRERLQALFKSHVPAQKLGEQAIVADPLTTRRSRMRPLSGNLVLSKERVVFTPRRWMHALDPAYWLGGRKPLELPLSTIERPSTHSWLRGWFFGVPGQRFLRIRTVDGRTHIFQSQSADRFARRIARLAGRSTNEPA